MYDRELIFEILKQIREAARRIQRRFYGIRQPDDFLATDEGLDRLDGIAMMLITIGESLKKIDKITRKALLKRYPDFDWKGAKGVRDIISHHYFDINAEVVFNICQQHIPELLTVVEKILQDLNDGSV